jgi:hypothetical protein
MRKPTSEYPNADGPHDTYQAVAKIIAIEPLLTGGYKSRLLGN